MQCLYVNYRRNLKERQQVQTVRNTLKRGGVMKHINIIEIKGKEINLATLEKEELRRLANEWNRRAAEEVGYQEIKTA